jgi:hypothetical protein
MAKISGNGHLSETVFRETYATYANEDRIEDFDSLVAIA